MSEKAEVKTTRMYSTRRVVAALSFATGAHHSPKLDMRQQTTYLIKSSKAEEDGENRYARGRSRVRLMFRTVPFTLRSTVLCGAGH